jgi:hypothetical protein
VGRDTITNTILVGIFGRSAERSRSFIVHIAPMLQNIKQAYRNISKEDIQRCQMSSEVKVFLLISFTLVGRYHVSEKDILSPSLRNWTGYAGWFSLTFSR